MRKAGFFGSRLWPTVLVLAVALLWSGTAQAGSILLPELGEDFNVELFTAGDEDVRQFQSDKSYLVGSNIIYFNLESLAGYIEDQAVNGSEATITIGGEKKKFTVGQDDLSEEYIRIRLEEGPNTVKIKLDYEPREGGAEPPEDINLTFFRYSAPTLGASYRAEYSKGDKLSAFGGEVRLEFTKGTYALTGTGVTSQDILFVVEGGTEPSRYKFISPIYDIQPISSTAQLLYPGSVSIKYSEQVSSTVGDLITVMYSENGTAWEPIGGVTNVRKKEITAPFTKFGSYVVALGVPGFTDFDSTIIGKVYADEIAWSQPYVEALWAKGILEARDANADAALGLTAATYDVPNTPNPPPESQLDDALARKTDAEGNTVSTYAIQVTRGEFAAMMVKALGLPLVYQVGNFPASGGMFSDVGETVTTDVYVQGEVTYTPDAVFIETAAKYGIVNGFPSESDPKPAFKPAEPLTREQAAVMLARALNLRLETDQTRIDQQLKKFNDKDAISSWAKASVAAVGKKEYFAGYDDGRFAPQDEFSRVEAAAVIYRIMKNLKRL